MESRFLPVIGQDDDKQCFGMYKGVVVNRNSANQITAQVPQILGMEPTNWANPIGTISTAPEPGTPVAIWFMGGDINWPYYMPLENE